MTLKEQLNVMQAAEEGKPIEWRIHNHGVGYSAWVKLDISDHSWNWVKHEYRIAKHKFPELPSHLKWHNPNNVKEEQFGYGFRPLTDLEVLRNRRSETLNPEIDVWTLSTKKWNTNPMWGNDEFLTYRVPISKPLPNDKTWSVDSHPEGLIWVRSVSSKEKYLITSWLLYGVQISNISITYDSLLRNYKQLNGDICGYEDTAS